MNEIMIPIPKMSRSFKIVEEKLLNRPLIPAGPKTKQFETFAAHNHDLSTKWDEFEGLLAISQQAAGFADFQPTQAAANCPTLFPVARRPPDEVQSMLQLASDRQVQQFVCKLADRFGSLAAQGRLGVHEVAPEDHGVVRYFSTSCRKENDSYRDNRHIHHTSTTWLDGKLVEIIDCESFPIDRAPKLPGHVRQIISKIPEWLRAISQIIVGEKIHEVKTSKMIGQESWSEPIPSPPVYHHDPILTVGPYVLAAWDD